MKRILKSSVAFLLALLMVFQAGEAVLAYTAEEVDKKLNPTDYILLTDITYIPLNGSFCYLSTILDACTKQVLSHVLSESFEVDFVLETVQRLVEKHSISLNKETIIHSDQGCHYTCIKFIGKLNFHLYLRFDFRCSMGNPVTNR
ncbi:MAG: hypothetical protein IKO68_13505 [Oscillospiraceae bacterium]|nr:hypothetical protein [Oscillospiraceae bacterium]